MQVRRRERFGGAGGARARLARAQPVHPRWSFCVDPTTPCAQLADYVSASGGGARDDVAFAPPPPYAPAAGCAGGDPPLLITSLMALTRLRPVMDSVVLEVCVATAAAVRSGFACVHVWHAGLRVD